MNHKQLDSLLKILKLLHPELPLSSRTLLGTERTLQVTQIKTARGDDGYYYYFGIKQALEKMFTQNDISVFVVNETNFCFILMEFLYIRAHQCSFGQF